MLRPTSCTVRSVFSGFSLGSKALVDLGLLVSEEIILRHITVGRTALEE